MDPMKTQKLNYAHGIVHFFFTLIVYLGLPLAGWGLGDLKGYFSDPARLGLAIFIGISAVLAAWQGMVIPEGQDQKGKKVARQTVFLVTVQLLGAALLFLLGFCDRRGSAALPESEAVRLAGLGLAILGGGVMFWSVLDLGRQYSAEVTIQRDHRLVTHGLYRFIRHPRYLGLIVLVLGAALVYRAWIGMAADIVLLAALLWRIHDEEAMLQREFGAQWETYCKRTKRLLPWIW
jgi:protein-S-isoprenylcysteine O-methyltransferase Ste14